MKVKKDKEIILTLTVEISTNEIKEYKIKKQDLINIFIEFLKDRVVLDNKEYGLVVILHDRAKEYFGRINPITKKMNIFQGLPPKIEQHFKLPESYKLLSIEENLGSFKKELFRNHK